MTDHTAARHEPDMKNTAKVWFNSWQIGQKIRCPAASPVPDAERNSPAARRARAGAVRKPRGCRCRSRARTACAGIVCGGRRRRRRIPQV